MALYSYEGFNQAGKKVKGQLDGSSVHAVKDQLTKKGIFVSSIELVSDLSATLPWYKKLFVKKVTLKDKILFTKQLEVLLRSGIPLMQSLADGLKKYPKIFDNIYVQLIKAGEATGKLEIILKRLTIYLERRAEIQKKVKGALSYPMIQIVIIALVVVFLLYYVVPKFVNVFKKQGDALPTPTKILLSISGVFQSHYILLAIITFAIVGAFMYVKSQEWGKLYLDKIKLKLPLIKYFTRMNAVVQLTRTLGMLLESGVNLSEALDIVCNIINNRVLATSIKQARDKIVKEGKIAQYLKDTNIFDPMAIYLIRTGEQSGELAKMLLVVAENSEEELSALTDSLSAKIEPIMMIFMAVVVGFIVISIALPMTQLAGTIGKGKGTKV